MQVFSGTRIVEIATSLNTITQNLRHGTRIKVGLRMQNMTVLTENTISVTVQKLMRIQSPFKQKARTMVHSGQSQAALHKTGKLVVTRGQSGVKVTVVCSSVAFQKNKLRSLHQIAGEGRVLGRSFRLSIDVY